MRVLRGRAGDLAADAVATTQMLDRVAEGGKPALRVWIPRRHLAFGRRDARSPGYSEAREIAAARGFPPMERRVGGRAVAHTGSTVAVALAVPVEDVRVGVADRYETTTAALQRALWQLGVSAQRGEPPGAFCPGNHSLQWRGKVAGLAQRVRTGVALVGAVIIVRDHEIVVEVLAPVYRALGVSFDSDAVGSIGRAGGRDDADAVIAEVETALVGDREIQVEEVD